MLRALNSTGVSLLSDHCHCRVTSLIGKCIPFLCNTCHSVNLRVVGLEVMTAGETKSKSRIFSARTKSYSLHMEGATYHPLAGGIPGYSNGGVLHKGCVVTDTGEQGLQQWWEPGETCKKSLYMFHVGPLFLLFMKPLKQKQK